MGSSAGGLDALKRFFGAIPADSGLVFVLIQHLDPSHGSLLAELVARCTRMPVVQVEAATPVVANHVYCIPPGRYLSISEATLRLTAPGETASVRMPIDLFLRALAADAHERGIGILLSGTGTDGTIGLRAIKASGGVTIVQDPGTAEHDGMPNSAITAGAADHVVSPEQMPGILLDYVGRHSARGAGRSHPAGEIERDRLNEILTIVHDRTKFDLRGYKRSTLERRIGRRMGLRHVEHLADYGRLLTDEPAELAALSADLLISVTSFFRDPEAWRFLQERVLRPLIQGKAATAALRVWVPACATGEEAYSVAMLLIEELRAARKSIPMQIFASDVDTAAIDFARAGLYPKSIVTDVSAERLGRFFVTEGPAIRVGKELRESVVFARQNLLVDPPFSRLDLTCCRNFLMYLEPDAQKHVITLLHAGLAEGGHLFLGSASTVWQADDLFEVVSKKWRVYRRIGPTRHDRLHLPLRPKSDLGRPVDPSAGRTEPGRLATLAQQLLLERFVPASVLVNRRYEILYFAGPTQDYLVQPTGVPTQDLMARVRDGLQAKLRGAIRAAIEAERRTVVTGARVRRGDLGHRVTITVEPIKGAGSTEGLLLVSFADEPRATPAGPEVADPPAGSEEPVVRQLEHELKATRSDLQGSIADLESTNQELKVANEEIMSVNEEMRSTNEELETSKEELQSLNEELSTVNTELQEKVVELEGANNDLDNLLISTNIATIFLDRSFHVRRFTPSATRLFNLIRADLGRPIGDVTQRCVDPGMLSDAETVLAQLAPISKEVQGHDGRWYVRQVLPYRTHDDRIEGVVITFSDVAAEALQEARLYAEGIVDTIREPLLVLDAELRVQSANRAFYQTFQLSPEAAVDHLVYEIGDGRLDVRGLRTLLGEMLTDKRGRREIEVEHDFAGIGRRVMLFHARTLARGGGRPDLILLGIEDITERHRAQRLLRDAEAMMRAGVQTAVDGVVTIDERGIILSFNPAAERIFGYGAEEVMGENVWMLIPASEREAYHAKVEDYARIGGRRFTTATLEVRAQRKNGTIFPLDLHVSEFADTGGRRFVGTVRDVTERKLAEEQVRRRQGELAHVLRVATVERLAAGLAHELNQPLSAIANDVEACATHVRSGNRDPAQLLAMLERAGAEALRAGEIVHHLRMFVQRTEPRFEVMDLSEVVRQGVRWLAREMEHEGIMLRLDLPPQALSVSVDRVQIEQVLVNLLQNAIDAIVEAGGETREIRVRVSQPEDAMAEVAVEDTGVGLPAAAVERLYEPFFTTKAKGMGLGLAICRTIVEMHHGQLSVAPRASGHGTTVRLTVPLDVAPPADGPST